MTNGPFTGGKRPLYATERAVFIFSAYMVKTGIKALEWRYFKLYF